jgi:hypothetical protein
VDNLYIGIRRRKNESDLCVSLFFADYMYINGKYDGISFVFLTGQSLLNCAMKTTEKPVAILNYF